MNVVLYSRVSSEEQVQGYSLTAQRNALRQECASQNYTIVAEYTDEGRSAKSDTLDKRPGFRAALSAVESGQARAILVHKLDRAARNLRVLLDVLHRTDGGIISVVERTDYSTPQGKFFIHMLGVLGQFYSDNLSQETKKGQTERARQGMYHGRLPFGLTKDPRDTAGKLPPVRDAEPFLCTVEDKREWSRFDLLRLMFERAASGASLPQIAAELHGIGLDFGGHSTVAHILKNRFYLGEIPICDETGRKGHFTSLPGVHEAFIDAKLFDVAARVRAEHRRGHSTAPRASYSHPLSGLGRCGRCGGSLHCHYRSDRVSQVYCETRRVRRGCDQPVAREDSLERQALAYLQMLMPQDAEICRQVIDAALADRTDHRRDKARLERQAKKLADLYLWGDLGQKEYTAKKRSIDEQLAACAVDQPSRKTAEAAATLLQHIDHLYALATETERREMLAGVFRELRIDAGRITHITLQPAFDRLVRAWQLDGVSQAAPTGKPSNSA